MANKARFHATAGLDELVAGLIAPAVEDIAEEVELEAEAREPGMKRWMCLTGDTPVHGVDVKAAARRHHKGPVVRVTTASGRVVTATPEHRVLTGRGWLELQFLRQGDHLFQVVGVDPARAPHVQDFPPLIGEVVDAAIDAAAPGQVRTVRGRVDFDGNRTSGDVDVVEADGLLSGHLEAGVTENVRNLFLVSADTLGHVAFLPGSHLRFDHGWHLAATGTLRCGFGDTPPLFDCHPRGPDHARGRLASGWHVVSGKSRLDGGPRHSVLGSKGQRGLAGTVGGDNVVLGKLDLAGNTLPLQLLVDTPDRHLKVERDTRGRLSRLVAADDVVDGSVGDSSAFLSGGDDRLFLAADRDVVFAQDGFDRPAGGAVSVAQGSDRLAFQVVADQGGVVDCGGLNVCCGAEAVGLLPVADWDAASGKGFADTPRGDAPLMCDRSGRNAGLVAADHVVDVAVSEFEGHVYDLSTASEWFLANGLIVHNSVMDGKQCPSCAAMHGVTIPTNDLFEVPAFKWEREHRGVAHVYMQKPPGPLEPGQANAAIWWDKHQHQCRCKAVPAGDYDSGITTGGPTVAGTRVEATVEAQGPKIEVAEYGTVHGGGRFTVEGDRFMGEAAQAVARRRNQQTRVLRRGR